MAGERFDDLTDVYEAMIDWPKRLAGEEGLFRWLFARISAKRVLDAACGTGRHAAMFHSWGMQVDGADLSENMIARARSQFGQPVGLNWVIRGFSENIPSPGEFDAAICVGNSLALAGDERNVAATLKQMLAALRPGGAIVVHVLNLWRIPDGPPTWQKCLRAALPQGESLIIKGVRRCGSRGFVDLLVTRLDATPAMQTECVSFLGLEAKTLEQMARAGGATSVEFFGDYQRHPYNHNTSQDLIMVALR